MPEGPTSIPITLPQVAGTALEGLSPVVVLGPNGSGKTRYAIALANATNAGMVSALRNIALGVNIPAYAPRQATSQLQQQINNQRGEQYWQLSNEIDTLFAKLLSDDAAAAVRFRDSIQEGCTVQPEATALQTVRSLWSRIFPGRQISFDTYSPLVRSEYSSEDVSYSATRMSDGERVALYLTARVLDAEPGIMIIDEPDLFFHSRLAIRFWDELELIRPDIRFVYVTHDLQFALSRREARYVLVSAPNKVQLLSVDESLPESVLLAILGAASFSIYASRIVFCEGTEGQGKDYSLYRTWFSDRGTAVIPVGSCNDVLRCVVSFNTPGVISGVSAVGIIDRDYWPDSYLESLPASLRVLSVHEMESLFCIRGVFVAISTHLGHSDANRMYDSFLARARSLPEAFLTKQMAERCKLRIVPAIQSQIGTLSGADDLATFVTQAVARLQPASWILDATAIVSEEKARVMNAVSGSGSEHDLLSILPGKPLLPIVARELAITVQAYKDLVEKALRSESEAMRALRTSLEAALGSYLPNRTTE